MHLHEGLGLDGIERLRATGHGTGVPMLEETAGVENERILCVGQLLRGRKLRGNELPLAAWELIGEEHRRTRVLRRRARPQYPRAPEFFVREAGQARRERGDFA